MAYGPERSAYDVDWVAATARAHDPSLLQGVAVTLAAEAYDLLRAIGSGDAPALARELMSRHADADVSGLNAVATAAVELFETTS